MIKTQIILIGAECEENLYMFYSRRTVILKFTSIELGKASRSRIPMHICEMAPGPLD